VCHRPGCYRLWPGFPTCLATRAIGNSLEHRQMSPNDPTTPITQRLPAITRHRFRLDPRSLTTTRGITIVFSSSGY
jgi:hypothetical protein